MAAILHERSYPTGYCSIVTGNWYTNGEADHTGRLTPVFQALSSENEAVSRFTSLALVFIMPLAHVAELGIGAVRGLHSVCTFGSDCGTDLGTFECAMRYLANGAGLLSSPYEHLLNTINVRPGYQFNDVDRTDWIENRKFGGYGAHSVIVDKKVGWHHFNGIVSDYVLNFIYGLPLTCYRSENWFVKQVCSRLCYPLIALCAIVTRVFDGALGLIVAPISLLCLGYFDTLNILAFRCLRAPVHLIADLFFCTVRTLNPSAL